VPKGINWKNDSSANGLKILVQEFSFKGYDQQQPGFSKPGFFIWSEQ
jgi:hypothetical protein